MAGRDPRPPRGATGVRDLRHPTVSRPRHRTGWPVAVALVAGAVVLGLELPRIEHAQHWRGGINFDPSTAQAMLAAIAGGMMTLTGFVFTAVTLIIQTVQSQSPRLLRALDRTDRTPLLFGAFTATFTFALVVLSRVRSNYVPNISVTLSLIFVLGSVSLFLRLIVTMRTALTVGGLTRTIGDELRELIDALYPNPYLVTPVPSVAEGKDYRETWAVRHQGPPGVFQSFDEVGVVRWAEKADAEVAFVPAVGDFVVTGATVALVTGPPPAEAAVAAQVQIGPVRTLEQDPAYGIRLLVDVALRALSPAVNDPTSVTQTLNQLDDILQRLVGRSLGDGFLLDASGRARVRYPAPTWEAFLALAVDEVRLFGAGNLQVARRLRALLEDLLVIAPVPRKGPVQARLDLLQLAVDRAFSHPADAAEAAVADRQGIGSARLSGP